MQNLAEVIRGKLKSKARHWGVGPDIVYSRWVMERFLHRLSRSPYADQFALKGGLLFIVWEDNWLRPTRDVDLEGFDEGYSSRMAEIVAQVAAEPPAEPDGVIYEVESLRTQRLIGGRIPGDRVILSARLSSAVVRLKVDTGFCHPITPATELLDYPSMLKGYTPTTLLCCPREMMLAEKLATIVEFGADNTRVRDYYDICSLANRHQFDGSALLRAIQTTFSQRDAGAFLSRTDGYWEAGLTAEFATGRISKTWQNWTGQQPAAARPPSFVEIVDRVREFGLPLLSAARSGDPSLGIWHPECGWNPR